ncbi:hypothetical protein ACLG6S_16405 [Thermodesulfobacteriota bacterium B35]
MQLRIGDKFHGQTSDDGLINTTGQPLEFTTYQGWDVGDVRLTLPPRSKVELVSPGAPHCCAVLVVKSMDNMSV